MAEKRRTAHSKGAAPPTADIQVDTTLAPQAPENQPDWTSFADSLPPALHPPASMLIGVVRAAQPLFNAIWPVSKLMTRSFLYFAAMVAPLFLWAASKWIQWYIMSYVKKTQRILSWAVWFIGLLPKSSPPTPPV